MHDNNEFKLSFNTDSNHVMYRMPCDYNGYEFMFSAHNHQIYLHKVHCLKGILST
jgi:hypothetical protein